MRPTLRAEALSDRGGLIELEAEVRDHAVRVRGFLARRGEIAVDEDRVGGIERQGLQRPKIDFSAAGHANLFARVDEPEETERFQAFLRGQLFLFFERRFGNRVKKVNRYRRDIHRSQGERQIDDVVFAFAHADDSARAGSDAGMFHVLDGGDAVVESVGGDDLGMVLAARVQVVIDSSDARFFERADFILAHQAQGAADVDADLFPNFFDGLGNCLNFFVRRTSPAVDDAVSDGAGRFRLHGAFDEFLFREKRITVDRRLRYGRLRAVVTIFRAKAAFGILENVDLHAFAEIMMTDFKRGAQKLRDLFIRGVEHSFHFISF